VLPPWNEHGPRAALRSDGALPAWQLALEEPTNRERGLMLREAISTTHGGAIRFAWARGDVSLFPTAELRRAITDAIEIDGPASLQYEPAEGYLPLRAWIAAHLRAAGIDLDDEDVVITSGA